MLLLRRILAHSQARCLQERTCRIATASKVTAAIKQWRSTQAMQTLRQVCMQLLVQGERMVVVEMRRNWMAWKLQAGAEENLNLKEQV